MGFLRRLLGGGDAGADRPVRGDEEAGTAAVAVSPDEAEREHELELARFEQERADELIRRQQRFADRSWTPPAQGGDRRSDDADGSSGLG